MGRGSERPREGWRDPQAVEMARAKSWRWEMTGAAVAVQGCNAGREEGNGGNGVAGRQRPQETGSRNSGGNSEAWSPPPASAAASLWPPSRACWRPAHQDRAWGGPGHGWASVGHQLSSAMSLIFLHTLVGQSSYQGLRLPLDQAQATNRWRSWGAKRWGALRAGMRHGQA